MRPSASEPSSSDELRRLEEAEQTDRRSANDHTRIALFYERLDMREWADEHRRLAERARERADEHREAREQLETDQLT